MQTIVRRTRPENNIGNELRPYMHELFILFPGAGGVPCSEQTPSAMLLDTMPLLATVGLGLKCSWALASGAVASATAAVLPLCETPAGVAVLLISAETAFRLLDN